jgi:hypothetical protein
MKTKLCQLAALMTTLALATLGCHTQPPAEPIGLRPFSEPPEEPGQTFLHALLARVTGEPPEVAPVRPTPRRLAAFQSPEELPSSRR